MPPENPSPAGALAAALAAFAADKPQAAIAAIENAGAAAGGSLDARLLLARCHARRGAFEKAEALFRETLRRRPGDAGRLVHMGFFYLDWQRPAEALTAFREAHAADPLSPGALAGLSLFAPAESGLDILPDIEAARAALGPDQEGRRTGLGFALARALDKAGHHQRAWETLIAANRAHRAAEGIAPRPAGGFPKGPPPGWEGVLGTDGAAEEGPRLVIVGGMPRAGKSTLESLLAGRPRVKAGYETNLLRECVDDLNAEIGVDLVPGLHALPASYLPEFRRIFARKLAERAEGHAVYTLTAPAPSLVLQIPVILRALPATRLILVNREDLDTALRIFQFHYQQAGHGYAYFLSGIMGQIGLWRAAVRHWAAAEPGRCLALDYEAVLDDPGAALGAIARFAGLPGPSAPPPALPDDRGCAAPYRAMMEAALQAGD
jgi:tetratricopeptide (TPR) repeat protein